MFVEYFEKLNRSILLVLSYEWCISCWFDEDCRKIVASWSISVRRNMRKRTNSFHFVRWFFQRVQQQSDGSESCARSTRVKISNILWTSWIFSIMILWIGRSCIIYLFTSLDYFFICESFYDNCLFYRINIQCLISFVTTIVGKIPIPSFAFSRWIAISFIIDQGVFPFLLLFPLLYAFFLG